MDELKEIRDNYEEHLRRELTHDSFLFQVAYQSLLFSTSWIEEFLRYVDDLQEEYVHARIPAAEAWHITTRLLMSILDHIALPRNGVKNAIRNKDRKQMKVITLYGSLQSLDRMNDVYKTGFKTSPIVANELVKILAKNSRLDAVDNLRSDIGNHGSAIKKLTTDLKELSSKHTETKALANAANNKGDRIDTDVGRLTKRVKTIEDKG